MSRVINAKDEITRFVGELNTPIKCATVTLGDEWADNRKTFQLKLGHTLLEERAFLDALNFEYDAGYGGQNLFGTIWFQDGTWAERGEYDGSEWWEHRAVPNIPEELT